MSKNEDYEFNEKLKKERDTIFQLLGQDDYWLFDPITGESLNKSPSEEQRLTEFHKKMDNRLKILYFLIW